MLVQLGSILCQVQVFVPHVQLVRMLLVMHHHVPLAQTELLNPVPTVTQAATSVGMESEVCDRLMVPHPSSAKLVSLESTLTLNLILNVRVAPLDSGVMWKVLPIEVIVRSVQILMECGVPRELQFRS
jgi:hypothetical protein